MFFAFDEALSLWQDFTLRLADGAEDFFLDVIGTPAPSD
jgi:hypothetical protein